MGEITEEMIAAAAVGVVAELNDRSLLENIDDDVLAEINTELRARIRAALSSPREVGAQAVRLEIIEALESIEGRNRGRYSEAFGALLRKKYNLPLLRYTHEARLGRARKRRALPSPPTEEKGK